MAREILVDIDEEGRVSIEADGYSGSGCEEATRFLEEALGMRDTQRTLKPEHRLGARHASTTVVAKVKR